jgi:hypothetical protein
MRKAFAVLVLGGLFIGCGGDQSSALARALKAQSSLEVALRDTASRLAAKDKLLAETRRAAERRCCPCPN